MKFISWNVNGLRAVIKKGFYDFTDFFDTDILILTLPYKNPPSPYTYKKQIQAVYENIEGSKVKHIVFTSSSSVYPKDDKEYLPTDNFRPRDLRAQILLECEDILNKLENISVITIRLGGIYGAGRYIKKSVKPRRLVAHKDVLLHLNEALLKEGRNDCINCFSIKVM